MSGTTGTATEVAAPQGAAAAGSASDDTGLGETATEGVADRRGGEPTDEAAKVLHRLERIEALDREQAPPGRLLDELRELVREAEAWARIEGDPRARAAVGNLREEAEGMS